MANVQQQPASAKMVIGNRPGCTVSMSARHPQSLIRSRSAWLRSRGPRHGDPAAADSACEPLGRPARGSVAPIGASGRAARTSDVQPIGQPFAALGQKQQIVLQRGGGVDLPRDLPPGAVGRRAQPFDARPRPAACWR